jgi:hypothetical protein
MTTFTEAKELVAPFITTDNAAAYAAETDKMIWVESNIMAPAGIQSSICTDFGEAICEWIECQLEA